MKHKGKCASFGQHKDVRPYLGDNILDGCLGAGIEGFNADIEGVVLLCGFVWLWWRGVVIKNRAPWLPFCRLGGP